LRVSPMDPAHAHAAPMARVKNSGNMEAFLPWSPIQHGPLLYPADTASPTPAEPTTSPFVF
jgi:hypothetical protein